LENLVRLFPYHQESSAMRLRPGADGLMRLEYQITAPAIVERRQDAELSLGMFLNFIREACGPCWAPDEVHFEHPKPALPKEHEAAFAAPIYFSQPTNALLFRPTILGRRMPASDLKLMAIMQTCLEQLSAEMPAADPLLDRLKTAIRVKLPDGYPALDDVVSDLRVPLGAVHRDLNKAGATWTDLVESVRRDLALSYVRQRQLPFSEIAMLLGYSELSAFSRAFRRWTGASPREWRARAFQA
jgi:AraC-like DNA-binding protein